MIETQVQKFVVLKAPGALVDNAAVVTTPVDTRGFDYLDLQVVLGALDADTAVLKLRESDDNATWSDIDGANFGANKPSATSDNGVYGFHVSLVNGRKHYVDVVLTAGDGATGTYVTIIGQLSRAKVYPSDAAGRGLTAELFV